MQTTDRLVDVHASLNAVVNKVPKDARRVEGENVSRVEYEMRFVVDLATTVQQIDFHSGRNHGFW